MTTVISAAQPRDLIAYAWFVMGYRPRESLVVVGLGGARRESGLVARIDLPAPRSARQAAAVFGGMLERNGDDACVLLVVSDVDDGGCEMPHERLVDALGPALHRMGIEVIDALLVGPDAFRSYLCDDPSCCPATGQPLESLTSSPVAAEMVLQGRTVRSAEADLVADVDPEAAAARGEPPLLLPRGRPGRARRRAAFERWCTDLDSGAADLRQPADLLAAMDTDLQTRDALLFSLVPDGRATAWGLVEGRRPPDDEGLFVDQRPDLSVVEAGNRLLAVLARRAPAGRRAEPLAVLAWLAWWSGDSVRGRLLAQRALAEQPRQRLAGLVDALLAHTVPPPWTGAGLASGIWAGDAATG